jgi:hypothetical protein
MFYDLSSDPHEDSNLFYTDLTCGWILAKRQITAVNSRAGLGAATQAWSITHMGLGLSAVARVLGAIASLIFTAFTLLSQRAVADEGGVSFWLPGTYGSLAAVPAVPGWSFSAFDYYDSVSASKGADFVRGGGIVAGVNSRIDFLFVNSAYMFATPVLRGQASLGMGALVGPNTTSAFGTVTGPGGASLSGSRSDSVLGVGDLYPTGSLRWNWGVNNVMTYLTGDIPVGLYNAQQLAYLGIGHGAVDAGGGYTYFDPQTGHEFSAVIGATYNLINPATQYKNGIDGHLDWGASQFLSASRQIGAVGYVYEQLTGDSGSGAKLGPFESRVMLSFPSRRHAGLFELESRRRIRGTQPAVRLEHVADVVDLAHGASCREELRRA